MPGSTPTESLLSSLRRGGERYPVELREIEISIVGMEFRRAFSLMTALRERGQWRPSADDAESLEDFWWEYCQ